MKSLYSLFLAVFFLGNIALAQNSNLVIFSEQGERFNVVLNGNAQTSKAETNVKLTGLPEGNFKVRILFEDNSYGVIDKTVYTQLYKEVTYVIKRKKQKKGSKKLGNFTNDLAKDFMVTKEDEDLVNVNKSDWFVMKTMSVTDLPRPAAVQVTRNVQAQPVQQNVNTTTTTTQTTVVGGNAQPTHGSGEQVSMSVNFGTNGMGMGMNISSNTGTNTGTATYYEETTTTTTVNGNMGNHAPAPTSTYSNGCMGAMDPNSFAGAKQSISSKSFEDSKMTVAKQVGNSNCFTAAQVKEVIGLFDFEDSRLEFAKFAYSRTIDPSNYYLVNDAFDFESSIDELNKHINGY